MEEEHFVSFLRPRKIGKSLFVSLLEHYYDVNRKKDFELLFGNLYIGKNPTSLANSFRILKFDFSGIDTRFDEKITETSFVEAVSTSVQGFMEKYQLFNQEIQQSILEKNNALESYNSSIFCII